MKKAFIPIIFIFISIGFIYVFNSASINNNNSITSFTSLVTTSVTNQHLEESHTIYLPDTSIPIDVYLAISGFEGTMVMSVYYNYNQIPFRVGGSQEYATYHVFEANTLDEMPNIHYDDISYIGTHFPIFLPENFEFEEGYVNKLFLTFVAGYDVHMYEVGETTIFYGSTTTANVVHNLYDYDTKQNVTPPNYPVQYATNIFKDLSTISLMINTDFNNVAQTEELSVSMPPLVLEVEAGSEVKLMYNIDAWDTSFKNAILILTIGYHQVPINGQNYLFINLEENATSNGEVSFTAPLQPGLYEVIAYSVVNPFNKDIMLNRTFNSFRFTLKVV